MARKLTGVYMQDIKPMNTDLKCKYRNNRRISTLTSKGCRNWEPTNDLWHHLLYFHCGREVIQIIIIQKTFMRAALVSKCFHKLFLKVLLNAMKNRRVKKYLYMVVSNNKQILMGLINGDCVFWCSKRF